MKNKIRNIGIMAHVDAGKTTVTERILFYSGKIRDIGEVHDGAATTDHMVQEQERGITITSAAVTVNWNNHQINLIDTPGHVDFTAEVERSLRVLDGAVAVFCAVGGVEAQSETVWKQAKKYNVPTIALINKMDRVGADFQKVVDEIKTKLKANVAILQLPVGYGDNFEGFIDIIEEKFYNWGLGKSISECSIEKIPDQYKEKTLELRNLLIETVAETSDSLMETYFTNDTLSKDELINGLRKATIKAKIVPILTGSALKNKGIQKLMDSIVSYLPSPLDRGGILIDNGNEVLDVSNDSSLSAILFKITTDKHLGKLCYLRIYTGKIETKESIFNTRTTNTERVSKIYRMHANKKEEINFIGAGEICAVAGLKNVITGDSLSLKDYPVILEDTIFPNPVIDILVEAKTNKDVDKLSIALGKLIEEDPTLKRRTDEDSGHLILSGMGELHLEIVIDRLKREFGIECNVGRPNVSYRETLTQTIKHRETLKKQTGGKGKYADIQFELGPVDKGFEGDLQFVNNVKGGRIPTEYIPSIEKGFLKAMANGPNGNKVEQMKVVLFDGSFHNVDSDAYAFEIVAVIGFREASIKTKPRLLEPVMKDTISVPDEFIGVINSDLNRRRAQILSIEARDDFKVITAHSPLSEKIGYVTALRTLTSGRGFSVMEFDHYSIVPKDIEEKILNPKTNE